MANTGLRNEQFISELATSGSLAIRTKNDNGIHTFEASVSGGIVSGQLNRPLYNENELVKSVDTIIIELLPQEPVPLEDNVPRRIYNPVTQSVIDLTVEVIRLNSEVADLQSKVSELQIVTESLRVEIDNSSIVAASATNQGDQSNLKVQSTIQDLSNAIQKATSEAIQRVSLTARTQALEEQNKTYKEEIEGKASKIADGHKGSGDITYKIIKRGAPDDKELKVEVTAGLGVNWVNGPEIELYNPKDTAVTVEVKEEAQDLLKETSPITIQPKETKVLTLVVDTAKAATKNPKSSGGILGGLIAGKDQDYDGNIILKNPGGSSTLTFRMLKKKK
jgi:tRNA(Ser,Leu) C12 N-acetylase TAN1